MWRIPRTRIRSGVVHARWRIRRTLAGLICWFHNGHTFDLDEWSYEHATDGLTFYCGVCGRPWWSTLLRDYPDADVIQAVLDSLDDELGDDDVYVSTDED